MRAGEVRVGVDIGGTFTDFVVQDVATGATRNHKVLSTPEDPSIGMLQGLDELGIVDDAKVLVHGTTAGLNALLSRSGERIALVTTAGFGDVPVIGRGGNADIWNLRPVRPEPLVRPEDIITIEERTRFDGRVDAGVAEQDGRRAAAWLIEEGIDSVAVVFLHAHQNPANELAMRAHLARFAPTVSVVLSHEAAPEQGEFERMSTTLATAYVARTVDKYLKNLAVELDRRDCRAPLQVMRSSGGICSAELVTRQPIQTILSGPAGGVVAVATLAKRLSRPNLIAIDMGGTSSDVSLVVDGKNVLATEVEIAGQVMRMPVVELHTIGAGGGSIARTEAGGLRVGPKSAGSTPGPACYGRGGTEPTVTDAHLLLGRIDAERFLGGHMRLDRRAAERAIAALGDLLEMPTEQTAEGILAVANGLMANAIRTLAMRRGVDPREFSLVAFGGAGPLHGAALADELGITEVIVPFATGVLSAWGMLHADVRHDLSAPISGLADDPEVLSRLDVLAEALRAEGSRLLDLERVPKEQREYILSADMRYVGQEHTLTVRLDDAVKLADNFHSAYRSRYGHAMQRAAVEFSNVRLAATGVTPSMDEGLRPTRADATAEHRDVWFAGSRHRAGIVSRDSLTADAVRGPAVIEEAGSTTLVPPSWEAIRDESNAIVLRKVNS
ncbi:hydantoinase/oxoprolinase family protein [Microbacterium sp. 13-71-7]|uniref:hydantoinase/oxoprolinase family protein n=1 Tax=Microbacterium sp. 13-71-7 TaxID=1970399 RepID=UPI000BD81C8A|nr:hydantoinase/oxoprolinase family protein [Microbacterium sp. 13-71-7]OZB85005.1 MAG: hypothetical protein B7X32_05090 [Microbacterium sp. 13-71-7]